MRRREDSMPPGPTLVVFSHLRWNFVFQRPQHLMTRLAADRAVLFIEEPVHDPNGPPRWELSRPTAGVTVAVPHTSATAAGFSDTILPDLRPMVRALVGDRAPAGYDLWVYTPMALPLAEELTPGVVVYDCMDELSTFKFAASLLLLHRE